MKIVLGSASPRRQSLLSELGYTFQVLIPTIDEIVDTQIPIMDVAEDLANKKAVHLWPKVNKDQLLICADTVVIYQNTILGKPKDRQQAIDYLQLLSGQVHAVVTGVVLMNSKNTVRFSETTQVHFKTLSLPEIQFYVENHNPFDKAGSYGIQDWIGLVGVKRIEGSYTNVMGLPTAQLNEKILSF